MNSFPSLLKNYTEDLLQFHTTNISKAEMSRNIWEAGRKSGAPSISHGAGVTTGLSGLL